VTASEFGFLALGLVLGVVSGAAIVELIRARPRVAPEVKVTVSHDAIPRRASTLADDAFVGVGPQPARGGPADRRWMESVIPAGMPDRRTTVRFAPAGSAAGAMVGASEARPIPVGPGPTPQPSPAQSPAGSQPGAMASGQPTPSRPAEPVPGRIMQPAMPLTGLPNDRSRTGDPS
jgi:hypothetical protein